MGHMLIPSPARESLGVPPHKEGELGLPFLPPPGQKEKEVPRLPGLFKAV